LSEECQKGKFFIWFFLERAGSFKAVKRAHEAMGFPLGSFSEASGMKSAAIKKSRGRLGDGDFWSRMPTGKGGWPWLNQLSAFCAFLPCPPADYRHTTRSHVPPNIVIIHE